MSGSAFEGSRVTVFGGVVNLALGAAKTVVGLLAGSRALVADGVHSLTDLATDVVVLLSLRLSRAAPDRDHPYGHGRIESIGSAILGLILLTVAGGILWDAVGALLAGEVARPGPWALGLAVLSILAKEGLYQVTVRAGRRSGSDLLVANAWHHRSDALTSVATFVGVGGAMLGPTWLDPAAAVLVAVIVAVVALAVLKNAAVGLIDTAVPEVVSEEVEATVIETEGVITTHGFRTRRFGRGFYVDVHAEVDAGLDLVSAHEIAEDVRNRVMDRFPDALDVTVHVDPWPAEMYDANRSPEE